MLKFKVTKKVRTCVQAFIALFLFVIISAIFPYFWHVENILAIDAFVPIEEITEIELVTYEVDTPLILTLCEASGIFFNVEENKLTLPQGVTIDSITQDAAFYIHDIILQGVNFPMQSYSLLNESALITSIELRDNTIRIRTRPGAYINYTEEYIQLTNIHDIYHTIFVLDAGHGGRDPGAINVLGRNEQQEADIVLAILQNILEIFDEPGVLIIPTRTEDVFVNNDDRYRLANRVADYFISIHTNADARSRVARGTLTLYGNADGSAELAQKLQDALVEVLDSRDRGIEHSQFRILRGSVVPVALLELLFLSTPEEARRLSNADTQMLIAQTIADVMAEIAAERQGLTAERHNSSRFAPRVIELGSVASQ